MSVSLQGHSFFKNQSDKHTVPEMGDLLVSYLEQLGVKYVFGLPGGAIEPFYNALARSERNGGPRSIVARHETGAAFMAHGYYKNSGRLAVCCATTGPGATNLITGVASAYENSVPMLVVTAQTALNCFGRGAFQESSDTAINTVKIFDCCTSYSTLVSHADQFERKLVTALIRAHQTRTPTHISVPLDVMRTKILLISPSYKLDSMLDQSMLIDKAAVSRMCTELQEHSNIIFVIGESCSNHIGQILSVALTLNAKIVTTPDGKGLVSPYHPLYRGVIGFGGHETTYDLFKSSEVSLIVAIGTSFSEWKSNGWDVSLMNNNLIHIEESEFYFSRSPMAKHHVIGNIGEIFDTILNELESSEYGNEVKLNLDLSRDSNGQPVRQFRLNEELKCYSDSTPIKPQRLMTELTNLFPPSTVYLADTGNSLTWAIHYLHPYDRRIAGQRDAKGGVFQATLDFASMGWAIGASVGVALAKPRNPVVCITGDGSWLMSGQEVTVARQYKLSIIYIILNDSALGMVKHGQKLSHAESIGCELPVVDYSALAASMGVIAYKIETPSELMELDVTQILNLREPVVLDVRIDPEEVPPMMARIKALEAK